MKIIKSNIKVTNNYTKISLVECYCGNILEVQNSRIKTQKYCTKCLKNASITHNMTNTKFYRIWSDIKTRGLNRYRIGEKAVGLSKRWYSFKNFYSDMHHTFLKHKEIHGERNTTIDRINNSKGYSKKNCKWATPSEQIKNRSITKIINGKSITEWCKETQIPYHRAYQRLRRGWTFSKTFNLNI